MPYGRGQSSIALLVKRLIVTIRVELSPQHQQRSSRFDFANYRIRLFLYDMALSISYSLDTKISFKNSYGLKINNVYIVSVIGLIL